MHNVDLPQPLQKRGAWNIDDEKEIYIKLTTENNDVNAKEKII